MRVAGGVWTEPVQGGYPDPRLFLSLSGLDQIRAFVHGQSLAPPMAHLTGMRPTQVGPGTVTFSMPVTEWLLSPPGLVQLGTLAILADGPLGCAVQTALPPATPYTTAELSITGTRPVHRGMQRLVAKGSLIHAGRSIALSEVTIEDELGRLVAHGTSRCFVFPPVVSPPPPPVELPLVAEPDYPAPPPYLRPVEGQVLGQDVYDRLSGLEILRRQIAGDLPAPPISHLTGLWPTAVEEGEVTFICPASEWLCSPLGKVEGGVIALIAETPLVCAVQTLLPAGASYAPLDLKVNFLRPVSPDGADLVATGRVIHRGKTLAIASSEVFDAAGRKVAMASGSTRMLPDTPWRHGPPAPSEELESPGAPPDQEES